MVDLGHVVREGWTIYQQASPVIQGGVPFGLLVGSWSAIKRHPLLRDKAMLARELAISDRELKFALRDSAMHKQRAESAEATNAALNRSIEELKRALTAEIDALRRELDDIKHKTVVQTELIVELFRAYHTTSPPPPIPAELRDEIQQGLQDVAPHHFQENQ